MPRDTGERCTNADELVALANEAGIPNEQIWLDPIVSPVSVEINQIKACLEFMSVLGDIAPRCKSIVGISNVSNGTPSHLRPYLNRTLLIMLMIYGLYAAIIDAFDSELVRIARGQNQKLVELVRKVMDGEKIQAPAGSEEEKYLKTVKVLTGASLYSHSWLEI